MNNQPRLLFLLAVAHRRKVSQHGHQSRVIFIKGFRTAMRHHKDGAARIVRLPREQNAIRNKRSFHAKNIEEFLAHREMLRMSTLQAHTARTWFTRKQSVQKSRINTGSSNPVIKLL